MRFYQKLFILLFYSTLSLSAHKRITKEVDILFNGVSEVQNVSIHGVTYELDLRKLLNTTAMIESNYGRDQTRNKHAISPFQYEPTTVDWAVKTSPELLKYLEEVAGRKLNYRRYEDSVYFAYLIYFTKLRYHRNWLDKHAKLQDIEWDVYKVFYNSIKGASTYKKWKLRNAQYWEDKELGRL